jgi:hypothetical protein
MADSNDGDSKRVRSPGYPALNLKLAIEKAHDFYKAEGRNSAALPITVEHWGYSKKSGSGLKAVAALKSFGLIEIDGSGDGRRIKLSELALRIILDDREDSPDRAKAIATAALKPKIHKKLWDLWGAEMPSHGNIRHHLIFEEKFNENFVNDFIKEYKATIEYSKLAENADFVSEEEHDEENYDEGHEDIVDDKESNKKKTGQIKRQVQPPSHGYELAKFPVGNNCTISLIADGPYSKKSIEALVAQLKLNLELGIFDEIKSDNENSDKED